MTDWNVPRQPTIEQPKPVIIPDDVKALLDNRNLPHNTDGVLMLQQHYKSQLDHYKELEMQVRKLSCTMLVEAPKEGVNNVELGNGYTAKVGHKLNYNLDPDMDKVSNIHDEIGKCGNEGTFIADRIFKWKVELSITEYRKLVEDAQTNIIKKRMLDLVNSVLTVTDGTPTLEIKEPKKKA